jgi:tetratricopeptide (TPR) repeat protein
MSVKMTSFWLRTSETVLLVLVFMLPLAFFLQTYDGTAIKTTIFESGTLALAFAWLFKGLERGRWELPQAAKSLALPAVALLAWTVLRFAFAPYKLASLQGFLKQVLCLLTYIIALLEFGGAQNARRVFAWITSAAWLAALYGVLQHLGFDPLLWKGAFGSRVFSTFGDPDFFGFFLALCVPLTLTQWLDPERDWFLRWSDIGLLGLLGTNILWIQSFNSLIAFVLMSLAASVFLPLFFPSKEGLKAAGLSLILATAISATYAGVGSHHDQPLYSELAALRVHWNAAAIGWLGAGLWAWLFAALGFAAWRAHRFFVKQVALGESCYLAGLSAICAGILCSSQLGLDSQALMPGWLLWPLAGMLGGLTLLARRGSTISVLPIPLGETARQRMYAPALLAFAGLFFFPLQWFDSEIENNIAVADVNAHDWQNAIAHFDRVRPGAQSYVAAQYGKGNAYLAEDKPQEAINSYAVLEGLSPDYAEVHYRQAVAYEKLENWQDAVASHEREALLHPEFVANYVGWAEAAKRLGNLSDAENAAQRAIALEPNDPAHATALAEIYLKEKRVADARKLEKQAAQLRGALRKKPQG